MLRLEGRGMGVFGVFGVGEYCRSASLSSLLKKSRIENVGLVAVEVLVAVALLLSSPLEKYIGKNQDGCSCSRDSKTFANFYILVSSIKVLTRGTLPTKVTSKILEIPSETLR